MQGGKSGVGDPSLRLLEHVLMRYRYRNRNKRRSETAEACIPVGAHRACDRVGKRAMVRKRCRPATGHPLPSHFTLRSFCMKVTGCCGGALLAAAVPLGRTTAATGQASTALGAALQRWLIHRGVGLRPLTCSGMRCGFDREGGRREGRTAAVRRSGQGGAL